MTKVKKGKYRHFKGDECEVVGIAKHSESLEELIVYLHLGNLWARPKEMFLETIERDGQTLKRFEYIGD
jgi:cyclomaltodextrinase / maltogenic alpha-amylase / neopullulanase